MTSLYGWCRRCVDYGNDDKCVKCLRSTFNGIMIKEPNNYVEKKLLKKIIKLNLKQVGFLGNTDIPLYERNCQKCGKLMNTVNDEIEVYCIECRPFPIKCC